jgi:hypothetical protein
VYLLNQSVSTTNERGNVNGSPCSGDGGGQHIDGQFANCGPNPNVALTFYNAIKSALEAASARGEASRAAVTVAGREQTPRQAAANRRLLG